MIGALIVDALFVAAVFAFVWGAAQLGGISTLGRLVEAVAAFTVAALLRDPVGSLVHGMLGSSDDFARLVGMILVATGTWIAVHSLYRWWRARREESRRQDSGADGRDDFDAPIADPLDAPLVARLVGGVLGVGWVMLFVSLLVLQPSDTIISRAAVSSYPGGVLIKQERALGWLREGFPHYTQTLPKGKLGAVVGERDHLPMRSPVTHGSASGDDDALLRSINDLRRNARVPVLTYNPDVAAVARRQADSLVDDRRLSYRAPGGSPLDSKVMSALGEAKGSFDDDIGIEVAWAHDPATTMRGLLESSRARSLLRDARWSEIGIGVIDAGWFNGRIYVVLLIGDEAGTVAPEADTAVVPTI